LKNTKKPRKFAKKKCKQFAKKKAKQANTTKTRKKTFVLHFVCKLFVFFFKFPSVFCISPAFPEVLPGNCKFAKKCKKMQKNVLPGHAANPTRKKMQKKSKFKMQNEPAMQKMQNKAAKKTKTNKPSPIPTRDALS